MLPITIIQEKNCYECDCSFDKRGLAKNHGHGQSIAKRQVSSEQRKSHLAKSRAVEKCYFCDDAEIDYDESSFAKHIMESHKDVNFCKACGVIFESDAEALGHKCSKKFDGKFLKCLIFMKMSPELKDAVDKELSSSCFTDENGIINKIIPGWPMQATCSIDASRNRLERHKCEGLTSFCINENQNVIQIGSSAILTWCSELNALSYALEKIEWEKNSRGSAITKPVFSRKNVQFKKDEQDVLYEISCGVLAHPYDLGHARAAGNCFTKADFIASFSSLNFWPMNLHLNRFSWSMLENEIRVEAKKFKCAYVTNGSIFRKSGKLVVKYTNGILIPSAFFKVAVYERYDGLYVIKCYLMYNCETSQSVSASEVSLFLIENLTKQYYLTPSVLAKVLPASLKDHSDKFRHHEDPKMM